MKNIKLKILTILSLMLLQTSVFCALSNIATDPLTAFTNASTTSTTSIVKAINDLQKATLWALFGEEDKDADKAKEQESEKNLASSLTAIKKTLRDFFIGIVPDKATDPITANVPKIDSNNQMVFTDDTDDKGKKIVSTVSQPVNYFNQEIKRQIITFYQIYATDDNSNKAIMLTGTPLDNSVTNLLTIDKAVDDGVNNLLKQEIYFITQTSIADKTKSQVALLLQNAEGDGTNPNNIPSGIKIFGIAGVDGNTDIASGSLVDLTDQKSKAIEDEVQKIPDLLNVNALIGPDGYSDVQAKNAKLFISQVIQLAPPPPTFFIPPGGSAKDTSDLSDNDTKNSTVTLYIPYASTTGTPYTEILVGTGPGSCSSGDKDDPDCVEYTQMTKTLNSNPTYQEYKLKTRAMISLRTIYYRNILRSLEKRLKDNKDSNSKSLAEKEKAMALYGLTKQYYDDLKHKSIADVNLELLYTLNKALYFLYELHQDNERTQLMMSIDGMQSLGQSEMNKKKYIDPINDLIRNKCWDTGFESVPAGTTKDNRAGTSANPNGICVAKPQQSMSGTVPGV